MEAVTVCFVYISLNFQENCPLNANFILNWFRNVLFYDNYQNKTDKASLRRLDKLIKPKFFRTPRRQATKLRLFLKCCSRAAVHKNPVVMQLKKRSSSDPSEWVRKDPLGNDSITSRPVVYRRHLGPCRRAFLDALLSSGIMFKGV